MWQVLGIWFNWFGRIDRKNTLYYYPWTIHDMIRVSVDRCLYHPDNREMSPIFHSPFSSNTRLLRKSWVLSKWHIPIRHCLLHSLVSGNKLRRTWLVRNLRSSASLNYFNFIWRRNRKGFLSLILFYSVIHFSVIRTSSFFIFVLVIIIIIIIIMDQPV
jgi:hypothetical protein